MLQFRFSRKKTMCIPTHVEDAIGQEFKDIAEAVDLKPAHLLRRVMHVFLSDPSLQAKCIGIPSHQATELMEKSERIVRH